MDQRHHQRDRGAGDRMRTMTSPLIEIMPAGVDDGEEMLVTVSVAREDCRVAALARGLRMALGMDRMSSWIWPIECSHSACSCAATC
jgi:hypothetical protein